MNKKLGIFSCIILVSTIFNGCNKDIQDKNKSIDDNKVNIQTVVDTQSSDKKQVKIMDVEEKEVKEQRIEFDENIKENDKLLKDAYINRIQTINNNHKESIEEQLKFQIEKNNSDTKITKKEKEIKEKKFKDIYNKKLIEQDKIYKNVKKQFEDVWRKYGKKIDDVKEKAVIIKVDSSGKTDFKDVLNQYKVQKNLIIKWRNDELKKIKL